MLSALRTYYKKRDKLLNEVKSTDRTEFQLLQIFMYNLATICDQNKILKPVWDNALNEAYIETLKKYL